MSSFKRRGFTAMLGASALAAPGIMRAARADEATATEPSPAMRR